MDETNHFGEPLFTAAWNDAPTDSTTFGRVTLSPDPDCDHHWHTATWQHTVTNHRDEVCCRCGGSRCVTVAPPERDPACGPYAPEVPNG